MKTGLYTITSPNGHFYIGSTSRSFAKRWKEHRTELRNKCHVNPVLQRAWDRYGEENMIFAVLMLCEPHECASLEQIALETMPHSYNLALDTLSPFKGRKHSKEAREKCRLIRLGKKFGPLSESHKKRMSESLTGQKRAPRSIEYREKQRIAQLGKKAGPEAIEKKRLATIGMKYAPRTPEHCKAISASKIGKKMGAENHAARKIQCIETGVIFQTRKDANEWVQRTKNPTASACNISSCCTGKLKTAYGYTWRYAD